LAKGGADIHDVSLPAEFERIADAHRAISSFEFVRNRAWEIDNHRDMISEVLRTAASATGFNATSKLTGRCARLPNSVDSSSTIFFEGAMCRSRPLRWVRRRSVSLQRVILRSA
jgi:hypothetical protein